MIVRALAESWREAPVRLSRRRGASDYDEIFQQSSEHILVRHEHVPAMPAEGYSRSTGRRAWVLVTSGPAHQHGDAR